MKKSLLAIVFAAATLPVTFAQTPAPAQSQPDQKSTAKPAKKSKQPKVKKTKGTTSKPSTTSAPSK